MTSVTASPVTQLPIVDETHYHPAPPDLPRVGPFYGFQKPAYAGYYLRDHHEKGLKLAYWDGYHWRKSRLGLGRYVARDAAGTVPREGQPARGRSMYQRLKWFGFDKAAAEQMEAERVAEQELEAKAAERTRKLLDKHRNK